MRPGFEFLCIPVRRRAFFQHCELCDHRDLGSPPFLQSRGQTLTRSLLSDSEELLLDSMPPTQIQGVFLLFLTPHSSKADLYHRYKLVLKGCHQGEVNCPQTRKVITTLIAVVY